MATTNTLGAKTDKGLEGIEHKIYLTKKSTQAKTIPNFIVRASRECRARNVGNSFLLVSCRVCSVGCGIGIGVLSFKVDLGIE